MKKFLNILFRIILGISMIFIILGPVLAYQQLWFALVWFIFPGSFAMVGLEYAIKGKFECI